MVRAARICKERAGQFAGSSYFAVCLRRDRESGSETCSRRGRATTNFLVENLSAATLSCGAGRTRAPGEDAAPTSKTRRRPRRLRRREEHPHRGRTHAPRVFSAEKRVRSRKRRSGGGKQRRGPERGQRERPKPCRTARTTAEIRTIKKGAKPPSPLSLARPRPLYTLVLEKDRYGIFF
ncbi:unnamed protein product, partial [Brenthis ino]